MIWPHSDHRSLDRTQTNTAESENSNGIASLDFCSIQDGANAGRNSAAQQADFFERCLLADFGDRYLWQHCVLAERRRTHVVVNRFAI